MLTSTSVHEDCQKQNNKIHSLKHKCDFCENKHFNERKTLSKHIRIHHPSNYEEYRKNNIHKCDQCNKTFTAYRYLRRHIREYHENVGNFKCEFCEKTFGCNENFKKHLQLVHENLGEICDLCGKTCKGWFFEEYCVRGSFYFTSVLPKLGNYYEFS